MREGCARLSWSLGFSLCGDGDGGAWGSSCRQSKQQEGWRYKHRLPKPCSVRDAALGHHHRVACVPPAKLNPTSSPYASSSELASLLIPRGARIIPFPHATSPCPIPLGNTHVGTTSMPTSGLAGHRPPPAQPANHPELCGSPVTWTNAH